MIYVINTFYYISPFGVRQMTGNPQSRSNPFVEDCTYCKLNISCGVRFAPTISVFAQVRNDSTNNA